MAQPGTAPARGPDLPREVREGGDPQANAPIVPDAEFNAALPPLSGDINAPLEAMSTMQATQPSATAIPTPQTAPPLPASTTSQPLATGDTIAPVAPEDPQLAQPLTPLSSFDSTPLQTAADIKGDRAPEIRYDMEVRGLAELNLDDEFRSLSALRDGKGKASNATQVSARAREDEALAVRLMKSLGYYDATAVSTLQRTDQGEGQAGRLNVLLTATPGRLYRLSSITVKADPTTPPDLVRSNLPLKVGDPIEAARIQGAEANVSLVLPQRGYPFVKLGDRDILLEDQGPEPVGAYTLPVDTGPRSSFGQLTTTGDKVFDLGHLNVFPRFEEGQLYDSRLTDDLRNALVATGLFNGVAVEPKRTGRMNPDGTEAIDLQVTQTKGPARTLSGEAGYSTGQGVRAQASFTQLVRDEATAGIGIDAQQDRADQQDQAQNGEADPFQHTLPQRAADDDGFGLGCRLRRHALFVRHQKACPIEIYSATLPSPGRGFSGVATSTRSGPKLV